MPKILCVETTSKNCSVAIFSESKMLCLCEEVHESFSHSEWLHTFISWALEGAEITQQELQAVAVSSGPGSYTGLRIGVSAAKGLCYGLNIPLISVPTLDILSGHHLSEHKGAIIAAVDARRMDVFYKVIHQKEEMKIDTAFATVDEHIFANLAEENVLVVGDAIDKIRSLYPQFSFVESLPSARNMGKIALNKFQNQNFESVAYFEPYYFKEVFVTAAKNPLHGA